MDGHFFIASEFGGKWFMEVTKVSGIEGKNLRVGIRPGRGWRGLCLDLDHAGSEGRSRYDPQDRTS